MANLELLTCSVRDYVDNQQRDITSYKLVQISNKSMSWFDSGEDALKNKAHKKGCEVVVEVRPAYNSKENQIYLIGTGLIPRTEKDEKTLE